MCSNCCKIDYKTRRNYFSEHIDARLLIEQSQRNVRYKTEQLNVRQSIKIISSLKQNVLFLFDC